MLTIIIPAYNEERRIGKTLDQYTRALPETEILVVLNGCIDMTEDVVRSFQVKFPQRIRMLVLPESGKGRALREGFRNASGDIVGFVDADGATTPEDFMTLLKQLTESLDGVIASRWLPGAIVHHRTALRTTVSRGFGLIQRIVCGLPYADTQCGAKVFRRRATQGIWPRMRIANMAVDVEILMLARALGFAIKEIPTTWTDQAKSAQLGSIVKLITESTRVFYTLIALRIRFNFFHLWHKNEKTYSS